MLLASNTASRVHAFRASSSITARVCPPLVPRRAVRLAMQESQRRAIVALAKKGGGKGGKGGNDDDDDKPAKGGKGGKGDDKAGAAGGVDLQKIAKDTTKDADTRMQKAVSAVADNFNTIRTGRANPAILDKIVVDYFGTPTPIKAMGSITVPESTTLLITPFDRTAIKDIERAIQEADIGINPNNDGEKIRLIMPPMTQERRKELVKNVKEMGEEGKVAVRNVRKDAMKKVDKVDFPKDDKKGLEDSVQKLTDTFCKKLDDMVKTKSEELLKL